MATLSWLTGTVNWMYIIATQHILGIRPTLAGLSIQPALPSSWPEVHITRRYRGATYNIHMQNSGAGRVTRLTLDGKPIDGNALPILPVGATANVEVEL